MAGEPMRDPVVFEAIEFAAHAHAGQYRKGTDVPYIAHPLAVARILIEKDCSPAVVAAGILHDTVEDTAGTVEQIRQRFGAEVAHMVQEASEPDKNDSWENRKRHTVDQVRSLSPGALLVEIADKLDNIRDIREDYARFGEQTWERFKRPREQQRWYYQALVEAFLARAFEEPATSMASQFLKEVFKVFGSTGATAG
jgi:(p)ppGpp synthase/HD superfamily hydrolase